MGQERDQQKKVFKYWNGAEEVFGDPLRIQRELYIKLGDPDGAFAASEQTEKDAKGNERPTAEALAALNCINDNAREAFGMVPYDRTTGMGATDEDVENALEALWDFLEKKSKSTDTKPSSEPSITLTPTPCPTKPS